MDLPEAFVRRTKQILGEEYGLFEQALGTQPVVSVRANNKMSYTPSHEQVSWCDTGYYLNERPVFTADPFFHCGVYYVQEASSMFLRQAVEQHFPDAGRVLDLCAAPGGKSTLLLQTLPEDSLVVCNEIVHSRANILAENIIKWGNANAVVTNSKPTAFAAYPGFFDAMVVDAPCSGEGMFRKDKGAILEWSENNVSMCAGRQKEILTSVWDALKTDGILVYSTCTYNGEENEENVRWICEELGADLLRIDLKGNNRIIETDYGYRFYPHRTRGEGFFISVVRKKQFISDYKPNKKWNKKTPDLKVNDVKMPFSLKNSEKWNYLWEDNKLIAYPAHRKEEILWLKEGLKCINAGILLGEKKGKDFIPSANVALSKYLDLTTVEKADIDYETAISFLKRESIQLSEAQKGFILVCYKGQPLGFVKNLGNRCNNLYPQEWRIRMNL